MGIRGVHRSSYTVASRYVHGYSYKGVGAESGWVRILVVCFLYKTNPNPRKIIFAVGKSGPNATFNLIFHGLGWPWVGGFVGFIIIFICLATQHSLVYRKHPITGGHSNQDQIWLAKKGEYIGFNADRRS